MSLLKKYCDSVFKRSEEANAIQRLHVYGMLRSLCTEYSGPDCDAVFQKRCLELGSVFTTRLEQAVNELKLIVPATAEAASALTRAVGLKSGAWRSNPGLLI